MHFTPGRVSSAKWPARVSGSESEKPAEVPHSLLSLVTSSISIPRTHGRSTARTHRHVEAPLEFALCELRRFCDGTNLRAAGPGLRMPVRAATDFVGAPGCWKAGRSKSQPRQTASLAEAPKSGPAAIDFIIRHDAAADLCKPEIPSALRRMKPDITVHRADTIS